jgi:hypothetical protein
MSNAGLSKVPAKTAAEICRSYELKKEARQLLRDELTPRQFLDLLLGRGQYGDAIRFLAYALPKREAVWWASLCLYRAAESGLSPPETTALKAAVEWVLDPSEEKRRAVEAAAEAVGLRLPAGCIAMGAFWSGGSMNPPNLPAVAPKPVLTAKTVSAGLLMAALKYAPAKKDETERQFAALGLGVAEGKHAWPSEKKTQEKATSA